MPVSRFKLSPKYPERRAQNDQQGYKKNDPLHLAIGDYIPIPVFLHGRNTPTFVSVLFPVPNLCRNRQLSAAQPAARARSAKIGSAHRTLSTRVLPLVEPCNITTQGSKPMI